MKKTGSIVITLALLTSLLLSGCGEDAELSNEVTSTNSGSCDWGYICNQSDEDENFSIDINIVLIKKSQA